MKNKLKRITQVLLCCFLLIVLGCETEKLTTDEQTPQAKNILSAKTWFDKYESNGINYELFQNLEYNWSEATATKSEDGTETIIVPVIELKQDKEEIWSQKLYLYKLNEGNFKALLFEIYPDKNVLPSSQTIDGGDFNGYMTTWDLKEGFVRASRFKNNQVIENGIVTVRFSDEITKEGAITNRIAPTFAVYYSEDDGKISGSPESDPDPVYLREVPVRGKPITQGSPVVISPRSPVTGGTSPGGFTSPGGGSGGGGITAPTTAQIIDALTEKAKCLNDLLNKNGNSFVQKLLANFVGKSEFDIKIVSKDIVTVKDKNGNVYEANGTTKYDKLANPSLITIEISTSRSNQQSALDAARTILHEYTHADIIRKLFTKENINATLDFKSVYEKYGNQHGAMAGLYLNSMKEALKEFHKTVLVEDYNNYVKHYGVAPSDAFYEAMAWGGLKFSNVQAWADLKPEEKEAINKLAESSTILSKTVNCPN